MMLLHQTEEAVYTISPNMIQALSVLVEAKNERDARTQARQPTGRR